MYVEDHLDPAVREVLTGYEVLEVSADDEALGRSLARAWNLVA